MTITLTQEQSEKVLLFMSNSAQSVVMAQPFRKSWPDNKLVDIVFTAIPKETAAKIQKILK